MNVTEVGIKEEKPISAAEYLFDTGLLFEINRTLLHPLGIGLMIESTEDGVVFGKELVYTDDDEGLSFDKETYTIGKDKFNRFMREIGDERVSKRREIRGYVVQGERSRKKMENASKIDFTVSNKLVEDKVLEKATIEPLIVKTGELSE